MSPRLLLWAMSTCLLAVLVYSSIFLPPPPQVFLASDKWLHLTVYAGLGCWFGLLLPRYWLWVMFSAVSIGFGLEYLQSFTFARQGNLWDGVANVVGCLIGLGLSRVLMRYVPKRRASIVNA